MMNLTQLQYFRTLARTEHVTKAAEDLFITQSTLSKTIASLEQELGYRLFDHKKGSIKLNVNGQVFLRGVENALTTLDNAVIEGACATTEDNFSLRIACPHPYAYNYLGVAIGEFLTDYPNADLYTEITNSFTDMFGHLCVGRLDCVVGPRKLSTDRAIAWQPLCTERLLVAVPGNSFPSRTEISLAELKDWNFCLSNQGSDQRYVEEEVLRQARIDPNIIYSGTDQPYVISHLRIPNTVAFLPESGRNGIPLGANVQILNVTDSFCKATLGIYYRKGNENPNLAIYIEFLLKRMGTIVRPIW